MIGAVVRWLAKHRPPMPWEIAKVARYVAAAEEEAAEWWPHCAHCGTDEGPLYKSRGYTICDDCLAA